MNWSFRIARLAGIDIKVHATFFFILLFGAFIVQGQGIWGVFFGILLILLLFVCVTLHELGHSLTARLFGVPVREIVLLPLGGLALIGRNPDKPHQELLIALAGPLVNVLIAALLFPAILVTVMAGGFDSDLLLGRGQLAPTLQGLLLWLFEANVLLALFNMIPAFPLDGGRVLRALLTMITKKPQTATRIAAAVGQAAAVLMGIWGVVSGNLLLIGVAIFIFFGAGQEQVEGQARTVLTTLRVGDAYNKHALTLNAGDRVSKVVDYILTSYQPDFAVMLGNRPIGIVTREDVLRALASDNRDLYVNGIMRREIVQVDCNATLDEVRQVMAEKSARVVAVYDGETYLGLVSIEDISEAFAIAAYLQRQGDRVAG